LLWTKQFDILGFVGDGAYGIFMAHSQGWGYLAFSLSLRTSALYPLFFYLSPGLVGVGFLPRLPAISGENSAALDDFQ